MSEWFSTGRTAAYGRRERLVRAWEPGDGVRCSSAPYNGKIACGEPVAVVKDVLPGGAERNQPEVINRVMCLRHLAKCFDPEVGTSADAEVESGTRGTGPTVLGSVPDDSRSAYR